MRVLNLTVFILQKISAVPVENPGTAAGERCGVFAGGNSVAGRFNPVDLDRRIIQKGVKQADGV